jgi:hypothetical protein
LAGESWIELRPAAARPSLRRRANEDMGLGHERDLADVLRAWLEECRQSRTSLLLPLHFQGLC